MSMIMEIIDQSFCERYLYDPYKYCECLHRRGLFDPVCADVTDWKKMPKGKPIPITEMPGSIKQCIRCRHCRGWRAGVHGFIVKCRIRGETEPILDCPDYEPTDQR